MKRLSIFLFALFITSVPLGAKGGAPPEAVLLASAPAAFPMIKAIPKASAPVEELRAVSQAKGLGPATKGGPTCETVNIDCNSTVDSDLLATDCALDDGTFVDFYQFNGTSGDTVTVDMTSSDFDTFLFLLDPVPEVVATDDDGGTGTNSRITFNLDATGTWAIAANNFVPVTGDPGDYSLTLNCTDGGGPTDPPVAPSDLTATTLSSTEIDLLWQDNSDNEDDFEIQMREGGGPFQTIGTVAADSIGANVFNLEPETTFTFRVRARNAAGSSPFSNTASATTDPEDPPPPPPPPTGCSADTMTLCLNQGRFQVTVEWRDFNGTIGDASVVSAGSDDSGLFWFFDPDNWEMLVKVLDGCAINDRFWVFAAATTNVEYTLRVVDVETGASKTYFNPLGQASPAITDTNAFATCP